MRPISEWTISDLQALIDNAVQESLTLDYKASDALEKSNVSRNEISKDFSAFANSAGGQIVYGIIEHNHVPSNIDNGHDPDVISREWLEQVVNSTIKPRLQGVIIKQISLNNGWVAYAVEIPQATTFAPHQASDNKYYKRFNFQSVPMEDYEVRDIFGRASAPELFLEFLVLGTVEEGTHSEAELKVTIGNRASEPALYSSISIFVDNRAFGKAPEGFSISDTEFSFRSVDDRDVKLSAKHMHKNLAVGHSMPIYREARFDLGKLVLHLTGDGPYVFGYRLSCPGHNVEKYGVVKRVEGLIQIVI